MADKKITALAALTVPDVADLFVIVDVSDTSMAASGTDKQISVATLDSRYMSVTRHGGKWRRAAVLSIPLSTVFTVTMDTEDSDTDGYGTATSTTFTIPAGLGGIHAITATVAWAGTPTGNNFIRLTIGGITYDMSGNTISQSIGGTITVPLNAADTIVMQVWQTSAGAMNATAMLMINRIAA